MMMHNNEQMTQAKELRHNIAQRQQSQAANPNLSVWVEASAGTGKTKVLSDRVLRLFLNGVNPAKVLCLTYTKAAAVEMNSRISARLAKWAVISDKELYAELHKLIGDNYDDAEFFKIAARARTLFAVLLDVPGGVKIQTIHSFCQETLKKFPLEAGISPYFSVIDDRLAAEAIESISRNLILKIEHEPNTPSGQAIGYLTRHIKEFKFPELMQTLADNRSRLMQMLSAYSHFSEFVIALSRRLGVDEQDSAENVIAKLQSSLDVSVLKKIAHALSQGSATDQKKANVLWHILEQNLQNFDFEEYKNIFLTQGGSIYAKLASKGAQEGCPEILDLMLMQAEQVLQAQDHLLRLQLFESTRAVMTIAQELVEGYNYFKKQSARLDYEDLIVLTRKLLENKQVADWVLFKLDGGISHVLIDEAQDTSPNQWAIIKALTADFFAGQGQVAEARTVFAVGDRKQSIYSFQGADPEEFDQMFKHFMAMDKNFSKVRLDVSFRSTSAVLETVNQLFARPEAKSGVIIEGENVEHIPYRLGEGGIVEVWPLIEPEEEDKGDVWYPPIERTVRSSASSRLAYQIATRIKEMVDGKNILQSQNRPVQFRDFMILVQRRNALIEEIVRACKNLGVAVTGVDKLKLLEQIAVEDLISLGRFLLLPKDDLSLAEVLKSPLFDLNDDDLFELCYKRGDSSLWNRLKAHKKHQVIATQMIALLNKADYLRPFELFNFVLTTLKGREKFISRLGSEAEDALDEFINLSLRFEEEHIPNLENFIQWISADEVEVKRELEQPEMNAVRLMTVHGSKGLQAPIVILPDTTRIAQVKKSATILWDEDNLAYFPLSADGYDEICIQLHEQGSAKSFDEYRRLLYVALTRAEDRLYICGYKSKNEINEKSWYNLCHLTLENSGQKQADKRITYHCPQIIDCDAKDEKSQEPIALQKEPWMISSVEPESPLARPYAPSRIDEDDDSVVSSPLIDGGNYFRRGLLIHRLLQFLPPKLNLLEKQHLIDSFLRKNAVDIPAQAREQIKKEILTLFNNEEFATIFGPNSRAEVPIMGEVDGRIISAQLDRLIVEKNRVLIVDFKTNRPAASTSDEVPSAYLKQLLIYKQLIEKIYPQHVVETFILWTNTGYLMKID